MVIQCKDDFMNNFFKEICCKNNKIFELLLKNKNDSLNFPINMIIIRFKFDVETKIKCDIIKL